MNLTRWAFVWLGIGLLAIIFGNEYDYMLPLLISQLYLIAGEIKNDRRDV